VTTADGHRNFDLGTTADLSRRLGVVVSGSLTKGVDVKLDAAVSVEDMAVGRYVTIHGRRQRFFGMVTDVELRATHPVFGATPPDVDDEFTREVLAGTAAYGALHVMPLLRVGPTADAPPEPVKTVPSHFADVWEASQEDVERIFGREDASHFVIGSPLDMEVKVCLDYERFIERSNGIFGKSGTGKTFLTRLVLASIIQKSNAQRDPRKKAVNLVFDMHNEYGWEGRYEGGSGKVKGLKQVMGSSVAVFTLDEESSRRRGAAVDGVIEIEYGDVEAADVAVLRDTLNVTPNAVEACWALERRFKKHWFARAISLDTDSEEDQRLLKELNIHEATVINLRRGLERLRRHDFFVPERRSTSLDALLSHLKGAGPGSTALRPGKSVVLEFGRYGNDLAAYMLVANVLTRRIHDEWRRASESAMSGGGSEPHHLMITIEEAHKFLNREVAQQTIFGEIAREMRKYNVTLLVIDQRPSSIEEEVMSQIGTKITCLLDNEKDVDAVLAGVSGRSELKAVLARLESKQQSLIFGHAVPMPVVVRTEDYGTEESYARFTERLTGSASDLYPE
jgi:DNA helicase HerA-like ATPase